MPMYKVKIDKLETRYNTYLKSVPNIPTIEDISESYISNLFSSEGMIERNECSIEAIIYLIAKELQQDPKSTKYFDLARYFLYHENIPSYILYLSIRIWYPFNYSLGTLELSTKILAALALNPQTKEELKLDEIIKGKIFDYI